MSEEDKKIEGYQLVQVPTEHTLAVKTPSEEVISINELIVKIANEIEEIKKQIA